ncbi:MAG TPA: DUF6644 family protein [Bryobacteraceae bacterium]|nr:DUF6644 family protein [Bryobacteraceae bacterium]
MILAEANPLNASQLIFPTLEVFHIVGFAICVGTIGLVDLRLLGVGMNRQKVAEVAQDVAPWTLVGLALILLSGPLMFSSDPDMYYLNPAFQVKMVCFAGALLFNYTIRRRVALRGGAGAGAKLVAVISLLLWVSVIFGGIFIAFTM